MPDMSWHDAIIKILDDSDEVMHYAAIADEIQKRKLRRSLGATPARTVSARITVSINGDGDRSPFIRVSPGFYMLKESAGTMAIHDESGAGIPPPLIGAMGMYWHHDRINWRRKSRLLGQQQGGATHVDFCDQIGVYLLHDHSRVIYVGRSTDRPLGIRLREHTMDRLNGRWNRFSWFGLKGVDEDGRLTEPAITIDEPRLIALLESILIEALEPPQNRKRGDDLSESELLQVRDPEQDSQKEQAIRLLLGR